VIILDAAALADRKALPGLPGSHRIRIAARSDSGPLFVALAPPVEAQRYLGGVARTELAGLGAGGSVRVVDLDGEAVPAPVTQQTFWAATGRQLDGAQTLDWTPPAGSRMSLVIMRTDGAPGLDATLTAGPDPAWLGARARLGCSSAGPSPS
jgi:hypothetical protein